MLQIGGGEKCTNIPAFSNIAVAMKCGAEMWRRVVLEEQTPTPHQVRRVAFNMLLWVLGGWPMYP